MYYLQVLSKLKLLNAEKAEFKTFLTDYIAVPTFEKAMEVSANAEEVLVFYSSKPKLTRKYNILMEGSNYMTKVAYHEDFKVTYIYIAHL